jgi:hypothetical protein
MSGRTYRVTGITLKGIPLGESEGSWRSTAELRPQLTLDIILALSGRDPWYNRSSVLPLADALYPSALR